MSTTLAALAALLLACCSRGVPEFTHKTQRVQSRTIHDSRRGVDARLQGRILLPSGAAAAGARVVLYERYPGWRGGRRTLGETTGDHEGRFLLDDLVFADAKQTLYVRGPATTAILTVPAPVATGGLTDLGTLRLLPYGVLEGEVDADVASDGDWIQLIAGEHALVHRGAPVRNGGFRLENVHSGDYDLRVRSSRRGRGRRLPHMARWTVTEDQPRQRVQLRLVEDELTVALVEGGHEVTARGEATPPVFLAGHVTTQAGEPLAGLRVLAVGRNGRTIHPEEGATDVTDSNGAFELTAEDFEVARLWIHGPHDAVHVEFEERTGSQDPGVTYVHVEPSEDMRIVLGAAIGALPTRLPSPTDEQGAKVTYAARVGGHWVDAPPALAGLRIGARWRSVLMRPSGHLPRTIEVSKVLGTAPPDLTAEVARKLIVGGPGGPIEGARVFLAAWTPETPRSSARPLGELAALDAPGHFGGYAPQEMLYLATVVAPGHAPLEVVWDGVPDTRVHLAASKARVRFTALASGSTLFLGPAGASRPVHSFWNHSSDEGTPEVDLAPGRYDLLVMDDAFVPVAGRTFEVPDEATSLEIDTSRDLRPRATLRLPPPLEAAEGEVSTWYASLSRSMPAGGSYAAMAVTSVGGFGQTTWPTAEVTIEDERTRSIVFHGSGRYLLHVADESALLDARLFREVTTSSSLQEFVLPDLDGVLEGRMSAFDADTVGFHHGVAGPRYLLRAAAPPGEDLGWSAIGFVPPRVDGESSAFRITNLPTGRFLLQDHLRESFLFGNDAEWGGRALTLQADEATEIGDVNDAVARDVLLSVTRTDGTPVIGGTVRVVDEMSDAWRAFTRQPTSGSYAAYPIPPRFTRRLDRAGLCWLPKVRFDRIVLELELDDGRCFTATVAVEESLEGGAEAHWAVADSFPGPEESSHSARRSAPPSSGGR